MDTLNMTPNIIFVDGSYYCFYRYHALMQWWRNAYPEQPLEKPEENETFLEKFKKTFVENLQKIPKSLNLPAESVMIVAKDCKREKIWRRELLPSYKANRDDIKTGNQISSEFFKIAYGEDLFSQGGSKLLLKHSHLEADDCIAISVKHVINKFPNSKVFIISSDKDYLQLQSENVKIFNLQYKNIAENKSSTGDSITDLNVKILMGDPSDNIPSVFPKCGPKTALKCHNDKNFFGKKMGENQEYLKNYNLNKTLIDFNNIPEKLVNEFMESIKIK